MQLGKVSYKSAFCSDDNYRLNSFEKWTCPERGVCLVTKVTATTVLPDGKYVDADPYTSSGTSYSNFGIISRCFFSKSVC